MPATPPPTMTAVGGLPIWGLPIFSRSGRNGLTTPTGSGTLLLSSPMRRAIVAKRDVNGLTSRDHPLMIFEIKKRSEGVRWQTARNAGNRSKMARDSALSAVRLLSTAPNAVKLLQDGARFCGVCGADVNQSSADPLIPAYPSAPGADVTPIQTPATTAWVNFTVVDYGGFFGQITNTIVVDG